MTQRRLGKRPAVRDPRNLRLASVLRVTGVPAAWDCDRSVRCDAGREAVPTPMFGNDQWGCCVMSARAHHTLRMELAEQGRVLPITDSDVIQEYLRETGGADDGLVMLDSLKEWRKDGWACAHVGPRDQTRYTIRAFAEVDLTPDAIRRAIFGDLGLHVGLQLPIYAERQFDAGEPWEMVSAERPGSWGGHCVYVPAYDKDGLTCVTWGQKQRMTWEFFEAYADEAYVALDAPNLASNLRLDARGVLKFLEGLA